MTNHKQETIKRLEAAIKEAQFQIDELNKPKTHYPLIECSNWRVTPTGKVDLSPICDTHRYRVGNMFETEDKAKASNLYKILNSEYDYWFPGFSEKPDFEPNGLEYFNCAYNQWLNSEYKIKWWDSNVYRWKRSEN